MRKSFKEYLSQITINSNYLFIKKRKNKKFNKYKQYRGCFGKPRNQRQERPEEIVFGEALCVFDERIFEQMTNDFNKALKNPDMILDMRQIKKIYICGGLLLKAFFEEYKLKHNKNPEVRGPRNEKIRAVFNHLKVGDYRDVKHHFPDIDCWQIKSWDHLESDKLHLPKLLQEEIIPKGWKGSHSLSESSSNVATSVSEAFYNCKEHAYTGEREQSNFKRWYLGVGDYPNSKRFSFLIYDKGIGIKARLMSESDWVIDKASDFMKSDLEMIELATKGIRRATEGRGKGLNFAINELTKNNGEVDIYSGYGHYTSNKKEKGKNRKPYLQGTLVEFSFPIEYKEGG